MCHLCNGSTSGGRRPPSFTSKDDGFSARPPPLVLSPRQPTPLAPVDNEIPDSANVRSNPGQGADVPGSRTATEEKESRKAQLNLGKSSVQVASHTAQLYNKTDFDLSSPCRRHYRAGRLWRLRLPGRRHHNHSHSNKEVKRTDRDPDEKSRIMSGAG